MDRASEMAEVKAELRKGKSWLTRYNRIAATVGESVVLVRRVLPSVRVLSESVYCPCIV